LIRMSTPTLWIADHVLFRAVPGAGGVLLDLDRRRYFALDEVATFMWRALSETGDPRTVVEALSGEYEADRAMLERDVEEFVGSLAERGWVHSSAS
jgi:hypothetical protein